MIWMRECQNLYVSPRKFLSSLSYSLIECLATSEALMLTCGIWARTEAITLALSCVMFMIIDPWGNIPMPCSWEFCTKSSISCEERIYLHHTRAQSKALLNTPEERNHIVWGINRVLILKKSIKIYQKHIIISFYNAFSSVMWQLGFLQASSGILSFFSIENSQIKEIFLPFLLDSCLVYFSFLFQWIWLV